MLQHVSAPNPECPNPNRDDAASSPLNHVLFVDDDRDVQKAASLLLVRHGLRMSSASSPAEAWSVMAAERVDIVLLDLNFSRGQTDGEEGFRCLRDILSTDPRAVVVVITGHSGVNVAVSAMRAGAVDFVMKPWSNERLVGTLKSALALRGSRAGFEAEPQARLTPSEPLDFRAPILGDSPVIERVRRVIGRAAPTDAPVLIYGDAGTGKSLIGRRLHLQSRRACGPFIQVDLAALNADEAEVALFGDGAGETGGLAAAHEGTLLLDEIGALASRLQSRLLAVLEAGRLDPSGSRNSATIDVRVIAASRQPRSALSSPGALLHDLLYRLNTIEIEVPPLHARGRDALLLAEHFLRLYASRYRRAAKPLSPEAQTAILENSWPGDVRALRQAMERWVIFTDGERHELADLPLPGLEDGASPQPRPDLSLAKSERALIAAALNRNSFNISQSARQLGLTRAALYRRMAKYGL